MTLIGGFRCGEDVVLCADTQETTSITKTNKRKLVTYERDWCSIGIAGAGNYGDLIDGSVQRVLDTVEEKRPTTPGEAASVIKGALIDYNDKEVRAFSAKEEYKQVELLIAIKTKANKVDLWSAVSSVVNRVSRYEVRGAGELLTFVADRLYQDGMQLSQGVLLAAYLLGIGKAHLDSVSGESHILVLTAQGVLHEERVAEAELTEKFSEGFDKDAGTLFLSSADPSVDPHQFEEKLNQFVETLKTNRAAYVERFEDLHLGIAQTNPTFTEPYKKLAEGVRRVFNGIAYRYKTATGVSGYSGYLSASPTSSLSPSSSVSPSSSASSSISDDDHKIVISHAVDIVEESLKDHDSD